MKPHLLCILLLLPASLPAQNYPTQARIYYWQDGDPWGWNSDSAIPAKEIIKMFPRCLDITESTDIYKLIPKDMEKKICAYDSTSCFLSEWSDSRLVIILFYPSKCDTISLSSNANFPTRFNNDFCFVDELYYKEIVHLVANKDRKFRRWEKRHFYRGAFHFFGRGVD